MASILDSTSPAQAPNSTNSESASTFGAGDAKEASKEMHVKIAAPYNVYYDETAESVSAENETGPFDVLSGHHNFMSLLTPGEIVVKDSKGENQPFKISRGIMYVHENTVKVFLDV
jgi:F0F1-type ATP synthase epsilon subunit